MAEVVRRRLQAYLDERDRPIGERGDKPGKFAYPPQLLLVDGGKGQLSAAKRVIDELELTDEIPVAGLAKRFEEVYIPGRSEPVEIPRGSEALFMLQRVRDEAHRFANTFHGERRSKRMTTSSLDGIPGLGEARKKKLTKEMGGVNAVKRASLDELLALSFLPDTVARAIFDRFHPATEG
jgi:excinuclease ABC subunit C